MGGIRGNKIVGGGKVDGTRRSVGNVEEAGYSEDAGIRSMRARDIESRDSMIASAADAIASDPDVRSNFVEVLSKMGQDSDPAQIQATKEILNQLGPAVRDALLREAGNPAGLSMAYSADFDPDLGVATQDPAAQIEVADKPAGRTRGYVPQDRLQRSNFASKQDKMEAPGTYGGSRFTHQVKTSLEQRSGADRYGGKEIDELKPWEQKQVLFQQNPELFIARRDFQEPRLAEMSVDASNIGLLTPQQIAMLSGVAPDQLTPQVMEAIYGTKFSPELIKQLSYQQRGRLVGEPTLTDRQVGQFLSRIGEEDMALNPAAAASGQKKVDMLISRAADPDKPIDFSLDELFPPWSAPTPYFNKDTGKFEYSDMANSGDLLARWMRTATGREERNWLPSVAALLDRAIAQQAPMGRLPKGTQAKATSPLEFANSPLTPGTRGEFYLKRAAEEGMPFRQFSDTPINRFQAQPFSLRDVLLDRPDNTAMPDQAPISTPEVMPETPDIQPSTGDTGYLNPALFRNPSVLAALLA